MRIERQRQNEQIEAMKPSLPYYVQDYIQASLDHLAPATVVSYTYDFQDFFEWMMESGLSRAEDMRFISLAELDELIEMDVSHYRSHLKYRENSHNKGNRYYKTKNKNAAITRKVSALRSLFLFLTKNANRETGQPYLKKNLFENTKVRTQTVSIRAKAQRLQENIIQLEEIDEFQSFIMEGYGEEELTTMQRSYWMLNRERDAAIISVLLSSGMRVGELSGLRMQDLLMDGRKLMIERKREKEDMVFFSKSCLRYLRSYLAVRNDRYNATDGPNDPLFVTKYRGKANAISKNSVQKLVMKYAKAYGKEKLTAHILRHSFGTNVFKVTKNIRGVQEALGHTSMNTTKIYTHMFEEDERALIDDVFKGD